MKLLQTVTEIHLHFCTAQLTSPGIQQGDHFLEREAEKQYPIYIKQTTRLL